jgi:hypothetical protein
VRCRYNAPAGYEFAGGEFTSYLKARERVDLKDFEKIVEKVFRSLVHI